MRITKKSRQLVSLFIIAALAIIMAGCGESPVTQSKSTESADKIKIGVLVSMNADTPFFITLMEGVNKEADRLGIHVTDNYAGDNLDLQVSQIRSMVDGNMDAIFVNPVSDAIIPVIAEADKAGVAMFTFDRAAAGAEVISHIASDNVNGGKMAGDYMIQALKGQGKIVELEGTKGSSAALERGKGFNMTIGNADGIEIVARERADFNREKGKAVFARILAAHPNIDGVFAHNDDMILGAIAAAKEAGREKEINFIGFDAVDDAVKALHAGDLAATIAQQPAEIGRMSVQAASRHLKGETVPKFIPVDLALITQ